MILEHVVWLSPKGHMSVPRMIHRSPSEAAMRVDWRRCRMRRNPRGLLDAATWVPSFTKVR